MPGLVSPKKPPTLGTLLSNNHHDHESTPNHHNPTTTKSPMPRRTPSPFTSRAKKTPPPKQLDYSTLDNPDLGPFLLKMARDTIASGDSPTKALDMAIRASKSFERCAVEGEPSLNLAMSLHLVAAIYCSLARFVEAIPVLERAIAVPDVGKGTEHALAAFSGYMQMGDTCSMAGRLDRAIQCYDAGLKIQMDTLGESDLRVAETCRVEDAIELLEYILKVREEKLGTANPDVDDEKKRLTELLREAGRARNRKAKSLMNLIGSNSQRVKKEAKKWFKA